MNNMSIDEIIPRQKKPLLKGWMRALLIIVPLIVFSAAFQLAGYLMLGLDPASGAKLTVTERTVIQIISATGILLLVFIFTRCLDRTNLKSLGLQLKGYGVDILTGIYTGALMITLGFAILLVLDEMHADGFDYDWYKISTGIVMFSVVAFSEELIMRGYILNNLMQSMNKYLALAISSMIFSVLHIFNPNFDIMSFTSIMLAGLLLGISYIYTKNLWYPIALHFSWNFFQGTVFGFKVSGQETYSIIIQHPIENNILNGGEFGFEGSIISQIFIVIAILMIWFFELKPES
ncbi:MAG: CPBP family intramembrane metalloprotease [Prevotellaceae bacterium]|nr:CPBP family intramembrane metalloprotease [Prevotellaceae bacterium]